MMKVCTYATLGVSGEINLLTIIHSLLIVTKYSAS